MAVPVDGSVERSWYAIYTRPRFEKKVEKELSERQIECFLPVVSRLKCWSDRKKRVDEILFPSYVFVRVTERHRHEALTPLGVVRLISFSGEPAKIPNIQIEAVKRILQAGYDPVVCPELTRGAAVEIVSGSLLGLRGIVNEVRGRYHLSIFIDGIRQSLSVNVEAQHLKVIDSSKLNSAFLRQFTTV